MRIGVVSDTHDNLRNVARIVELFNAAGVSRVIHTGDITQAKTLDVLARLDAPLLGVYGNNDLERDSLENAAARYDLHLVDPPLELHLDEREILVVHDPRELPADAFSRSRLLLHGHTHRHREKRRSGSLAFNPGECAGHMKGHNAVGVVELASLEIELLRF